MSRSRGGGRALLLELVRAQWRGIALGVVLGGLWTLGKVTVPRLVSGGIDAAVARESVWSWTVAILVVGLASSLVSGGRKWFALGVARRVEAELRERVFAKIQRLPFAYHDRMPTGELMSRANTDAQQVQLLFAFVPMTLSNFLTVLSSAVVLVVIDPFLTLVSVVGLPLVNVMGKRFAERLHPAVTAIQEESAQVAAVVEESVAGVRVVKGLGAERVQEARLRVEADDVFDASMEAAMVRARFMPAMELLPNLGLVAVLGVGGHRVIGGQLSVGDLVAFNVYLQLMLWPLRSLGSIVAQFQRSVTSADRIRDVLDAPEDVADPDRPVPLPATGGAVRFEGVTFAYAGGGPVLDGLDLTIEAGTSVAIVGSTGSGKTTMAALLCRFYDVTGGRVLLDGVDVRDLALADLRRAVATVFQETFLFSDTVAANMAFADAGAPHDVVARAARLAGADEFVAGLPEGYGTELGERGFSLSGGQRQRVAIARAVVADPRVLVLDDATSAVDPTKEHEIRDALVGVMQGRTTLVIAHRPATIALADRVVLLDGGRIAADGDHRSLLRSSARYRQVLAAAAVAEARAGEPEPEPEVVG
ncbi:MAG: ABC transporter ATP-binding protein [Acidimicrobiia bacterium]